MRRYACHPFVQRSSRIAGKLTFLSVSVPPSRPPKPVISTASFSQPLLVFALFTFRSSSFNADFQRHSTALLESPSPFDTILL